MSGPAAEEPDYLPIAVCGNGRQMLDGIPDWYFPLAEQVEDPEKMLYMELVRVVGLTRFPGDQTLCVAPRHGNSFLLTVLGLDVHIVDNTCWPARDLSWEEAGELELPSDLTSGSGNLLGRAVEFVQLARSVLPSHVPAASFFLMSPYDLANLIVGGKALLMGMYDRPDDVHRLLGLCCDLFIVATLLLKKETVEPREFFRYSHLTLAGGGMLCEDCPIMISPERHREFCIPYTRRALDAIGGGWVHWCGDGHHLIDAYLEIPDLYGFQFGQLELDGDWRDTVAKIAAAGKATNLVLPAQRQRETWPQHCRTLLGPLPRRKYGFTLVYPGPDGETSMTEWRRAQDEVLTTQA